MLTTQDAQPKAATEHANRRLAHDREPLSAVAFACERSLPMSALPSTIPAPASVHPKALGPAVAPRTIAEQFKRLRDAMLEVVELAEADMLDYPDDDGCIARDCAAHEALDAVKYLCQLLAQLPAETLNERRPLWSVL